MDSVHTGIMRLVREENGETIMEEAITGGQEVVWEKRDYVRLDGRFLISHTDTPKVLAERGLKRTSIWRSLKRGWYTIGYHKDIEFPADSADDMEASGFSRSAIIKAQETGKMKFPDYSFEDSLGEMGLSPYYSEDAGWFGNLRDPYAFTYSQVYKALNFIGASEQFSEQLEDIVQECLLKMWEVRFSKSEIKCPEAWYATVIRRKTRDIVEREAKKMPVSWEEN